MSPPLERVAHLGRVMDDVQANPTRSNLHILITTARKYERENLIDDAIEQVNGMKGGMMTPWAVKKKDVIDILTKMRLLK